MTVARGCLVALILSGVAGCQTRPEPAFDATAERSHSSDTTQTAKLIVYGMGCPQCANNVDKQLLKLPGVEAVAVNLGSGSVTVTFADGVKPPDKSQLAKAVADSGYTLVRVQTP